MYIVASHSYFLTCIQGLSSLFGYPIFAKTLYQTGSCQSTSQTLHVVIPVHNAADI